MIEIGHGLVTIGSLKMTISQVGIILVVFVVIGVIGEEIARYKGHSPALWLILCSLLPLLLIVVLSLRPKPKPTARPAKSPGGKNGAAKRDAMDEDEEPPVKIKAAVKGGKARR